jgi:hypothetical protein
MSSMILEDSTETVSVPTCLHPGCDVSGDGNLSECGLCRGRMCMNYDCQCRVHDPQFYLSN